MTPTPAPTPGDSGRGGPGGLLPEVSERLARRRRLLAWSSPLLALALTGGPFLVGVCLADDGLRSDAEADPAGAAEGYAALADDTRFGPSPWIAVYNSGTSSLMAEEAATAVTTLTEALDMVPEGTEDEDGEVDPELPECLVRRNLSLSYESLARDALEAVDRPMVEQHLTDALEALGPCTTDPIEDEDTSESPSESPSESQSQESPSESESQEDPSDGQDPEQGEDPSEPESGDQGENPNDRIQERQDEQRRENRDAQQEEQESGSEDEESSDGGEGGEGEEETSLSPQEQELADRNAEAERDRQQQEQREGGGYGGGQNW